MLVKDTFFVSPGRMTLRHPTGKRKDSGLHSGGTVENRPTARDDYCILKVTVFVPALPSLSVAVMVMLALPTGASVAIGMVIPARTWLVFESKDVILNPKPLISASSVSSVTVPVSG